MDLEDMLSESSQTEKEFHMVSLCLKTNGETELTDTEENWVVAKRGGM